MFCCLLAVVMVFTTNICDAYSTISALATETQENSIITEETVSDSSDEVGDAEQNKENLEQEENSSDEENDEQNSEEDEEIETEETDEESEDSETEDMDEEGGDSEPEDIDEENENLETEDTDEEIIEVENTVSGESLGEEYNGLIYDIVNNSGKDVIYIKGASEEISGALRIPSKIDEIAVKVINQNAFKGNENITSVIIPSGVTVYEEAFAACTNLTKVETEGSVFLAEQAFSNCTNLKKVILSADTEFESFWGRSAFYKCSGLKSAGPVGGGYNLEYSWTKGIPNNAFEGTSIETIVFPKELETIGSYAFSESSLREITFPDNVTISGSTLWNCTQLKKVVFGKNDIINGSQATSCSNLEKIVFSEGVVFNNCSQQFNGCSKLKTAGPIGGDYNIEYSFTSIPKEFFSRASVENIVIGDMVNEIGESAFEECDSLREIIIPSNVTKIGRHLFRGCDNLEHAVISCRTVEVAEGYSSITGNAPKLKSVGPLGSGCSFEYPWLTSIPTYAFYYCDNVESIQFPNGLKKIGGSAFDGLTKLTEINIPSTVTSIGPYAFASTNIERLVLPEGLTELRQAAFAYCHNLEYVYLPSTLTSFDFLNSYYQGCEKLETVGPAGSGCNIEYGWKESIPTSAFVSSSIKSIKFPNTLKSIGSYAFSGCENLGAVVLPDSVTSLGDQAFFNSSITSVKLSNNIDTLGNNIFANCLNLKDIYIPDSVTYIYKNAFAYYPSQQGAKFTMLPITIKCRSKNSYAYKWAISNNMKAIVWNERMDIPLIDRSCKDITIHVVDSFGNSIGKANIRMDGRVVTADANGYAHFSCENNKAYQAYVSTTSNGSKEVNIDTGLGNSFEIQMDYLTKLPEIKVSNLNSVKGNISLSASESIAGKKVNWLDIGKFSIDLGGKTKHKLDVEYDETTGIYKATFGVKQSDSTGETNKGSYDKMKKLVSGIGKTSSAQSVDKLLKKNGLVPSPTEGECGVKIESSVMGYISFTYDENGFHYVEGGGLVKLEGKGSITYRPASTLGLGYVKAELSLSATGKFMVKISDEIYFNGKLELEQNAKVAGGIGCDQAHIEVGAQVGFKETATLDTGRKWDINEDLTFNVSGKVYLEAKLFFLKSTAEKKLFDIPLWPRDDGRGHGSGGGRYGASPQSLTDPVPSLRNTYDISEMEMIDRNYLSGGMGEIPSLKSGQGEGGYVYPDGSPQIAKLSDGKLIAVWVTDLGNKSDANRTSLVYSVNNGSGWSEPYVVYEDGKNAFYPVITAYENDAYVAWVTFDRTFDDTVTAEEMAASTEIVVAKYHDGTFGEPVFVTEESNGKTEEMVQLAVNEDEVSVVWAENSVNDPYLIDGTNTIRRCTLDHSLEKKTESVLLDNLKSIYGMSAAYINDTLHVAYLMDFDGYSEDTSDIELFDCTYGRSIQITSDNIAQANPVFAGGDLYWSEESGLSRAINANPFDVVSYSDLKIENYDVICGNQNPILVFPVSDGFRSELFVGNIENTGISGIHPITEYGNQVSYYALDADSTGSLAGVVFEKIVNDDSAENIYGNTRLHLCTGFSAQDLQVKDMSMYTGDLKEDGNIPVTASVYNGSSEAVENVSVSILINGEEKKTETVECHLEPGETGSLEIDYDGGIVAAGNELSIKVNPTSFTDSHTDNNTASAVVEFNDLKISNYNADSSEKTITATLKNDGQSAMSNVVANIYEGGKEGEIVYTQSYGNMAAGAEDTLTYSIPSDKLSFTNAEVPKIFYLELVSDDEESNYGNNSSIISVFPVRVTGISLDKSELTMAAKSTDTLSVTVLPENAYDKSVIYLSSDNKVVMVADDGTLVATGEGEAIIMAVSSDGGFTSECVVTVEEAQSELSISEQAIEVNAGETFELTVKEASTEEEKELPVEITWSSSDETVATVDSDGVVTGVAKGTALIYASNGEDFHDSCMVYVLEDTETLYLSDSLLYLTEGDEYTLEATVLEDEYDETSVTWSSSDEQVVSVSDSGTVIALSAGQATVTATTDKGTSVECTVSVSEAVTYTVTFDDSIGGFDYVDGIPEGGCISPIAPPSRTGYDFLGWYTEKDGQGEAFTSSYAVNDNLTVYAYWKRNEDFGSDGDVIPGDIPSGGIPSDLWIAGIKKSGVVYEGTAIKPEVRVYDGKHLLKANTDYTISYKNNTNAYIPLDDKDTKAPTITVTGKGNYAGKESAVFTIVPRNIADEGVDVTPVATVIANGKVQKPVPVLTFNKKKLSNNKDFKIVSYKNESGDTVSECKEPGKYFIEIEGIKNFEGTREIPFEICGKEKTLISKVSLAKIASVEYTGEEIIPDIKLTNSKKVPLVESTDGETGDYVVTYADDHKEIGTHTVTITGINDYCGTRIATFSITGRKISAAKIDGVPKTETFTGNPIKPAISLTYTTGKGATAVTDSLLEDTDYTVEYTNNTNPGTATITITGIGHYTGTVKKTFKIVNKAISNEDSALSISFDKKDIVMGSGSADVPSIAYTKGGAKPNITVTFTYVDSDGETVNEKLTEKTDYTIKYSNNTAITTDATAKLPTVTVTGKGRFKGTKTRTFKIVPQDLSAEDTGVTMSAPDKVASSKKGAWVSTPVITDKDGKKLAAGKDYDKNLSYVVLNPDGTDGEDVTATAKQITLSAGTYVKVTARAIETTNPAKPSCYTGSISTTYRIVGTDISKANISVKAKTYTGKAIKLDKSDITVKVGKQILPDDSYEIVESTYTNNVNKGKATVVIKGAGDCDVEYYGGEKIVTFTIGSKSFLWWWRNLMQ